MQNDNLQCWLDRGKSYDLAEAYEDNLHVRFANADSDEALISFIRAWGPLYIPTEGQDVACLPLADCRAYQKQIKALLGALTAFKLGKDEREALEELIGAESAVSRRNTSNLNHVFQFSGNALNWAKRASLGEVRKATNFLIESAVGAQFPLRISCHFRGNRRRVVAGWTFTSLFDALLWMVWYDEFTRHPVICCAECRTVFRGETARRRKYCSETCGHRATAREAMRKKRAQERAERK